MCLRYSIYSVIQHKTKRQHRASNEVNFNSKENECPLNELSMTTRWGGKKEKRKTFTGPECVWASDWDQLMLIGNNHYSMEHANCFLSKNIAFKARSGSRATQWKTVFCVHLMIGVAIELKRKLHQASINTLLATSGKVNSGAKSSLVCDIRFDIKATGKQKCRRRSFDVQILLWPKVEFEAIATTLLTELFFPAHA